MKKLNLQIAFLLLGLLLSATSQATPPHGDTVWSGYYFGAYYGAGAGNARTELNTHLQTFANFPDTSSTSAELIIFSNNASGTLKGNVSGSIADLFFGYNFHEPSYNLVLGAQLEGSIFSDITWKSKGHVDSLDTGAIVFINSDGVFTLFGENNSLFNGETTDRLRSKFALVGRAGYLINPCTLIYALGGPVAGHFVLPAFQIAEFSLDDPHKNQWELGYTLGAGLELKMNDHWSLRGEYRYLSFNFNRRLNLQSDTAIINLVDDLSFIFTNFTTHQKTSTKFHDHLGEIGIVYSF